MRVFLATCFVLVGGIAIAQDGSVMKSPLMSDAEITTKWETEKQLGNLRGDYDDKSIVSLRGEVMRLRAELRAIERERQQVFVAISKSDGPWLSSWLTDIAEKVRQANYPRRPKQTVTVTVQ